MNSALPRDSRSFGSTARVTANCPMTLTSKTCRHSSGVTVSTGPPTATPALLTTASRRAGSASASFAMCSASVMSRMTADTRCGSIGAGELVSHAAKALRDCDAVMVVEEGKPVGVLTRHDLLGFLSDGNSRR